MGFLRGLPLRRWGYGGNEMPTRGRARPLMNLKKFKLGRLTFFRNLYILSKLL